MKWKTFRMQFIREVITEDERRPKNPILNQFSTWAELLSLLSWNDEPFIDVELYITIDKMIFCWGYGTTDK